MSKQWSDLRIQLRTWQPFRWLRANHVKVDFLGANAFTHVASQHSEGKRHGK